MSELEHRHLRSALEFAVLMAAEGQKRKPVIPYPKALKPFFSKPRIPAGSLGRLRRAVESDVLFRSRIAAGALPELVDDIGRLWLTQPDGWEREAIELAAAIDTEAQSGDFHTQLKRAERKRAAAEQAAIRTRAELLQLNDVIAAQGLELHELRAGAAKGDEAVREMRTELVDVRVEIRHARDREAAATAKLTQAQRELGDAVARLERAGVSIDDERPSSSSAADSRGATTINSGAINAGRIESVAIDNRVEIAAAADAARTLAEQLDALLPSVESVIDDTTRTERRPIRRTPLPLPGGVISTSSEAAAFLVRSDAALLIDGYNVAKLGWPNRALEHQRQNLLDAVENLARRYGTDVTVIFDGASVVGAHADRRRLARVVYSPEGVIADDVIRDEVRRLPTSRAVVVVTNDAEIVRDVRADGANVLPSNALLAVL